MAGGRQGTGTPAVRALGTAVLTEGREGTSRMSREAHVRICGGGQVRSLPALPGNCASLYGLSLLTFGRECDLRMARSDSSADTVFDVIEVPRSAWIACGVIPPLRRTASVMKSFA